MTLICLFDDLPLPERRVGFVSDFSTLGPPLASVCEAVGVASGFAGAGVNACGCFGFILSMGFTGFRKLFIHLSTLNIMVLFKKSKLGVNKTKNTL